MAYSIATGVSPRKNAHPMVPSCHFCGDPCIGQPVTASILMARHHVMTIAICSPECGEAFFLGDMAA